jgi:proton-translocating NADH-quinone oxidoreductase chain N
MQPPTLGHLASLMIALPELGLTVLASGVLLAGLVPRWRGTGVAVRLAAAGLVGVVLLALVAHGHARGTAEYAQGGRVLLFHGALAYDGFAAFLKVFFAGAGLFGLLLAFPAILRGEIAEGEFACLLLTAVLGMVLLAAASNLLMLYVSLELVSLPSYILVGLLRRNRRSNEAALKYTIYGAFASGAMIYGISLLVGITGETGLSAIGPALKAQLAAGHVGVPAVVAVFALILAGLGYKVAAVPFHFWCPDVYEGAPTAVTAFLSVGPKAAGFAAFLRVVVGLFAGGAIANADVPWRAVLAIVSVATMALGNLAALPQQNLKRLLAYSSIAHAGYLLLGLIVPVPRRRLHDPPPLAHGDPPRGRLRGQGHALPGAGAGRVVALDHPRRPRRPQQRRLPFLLRADHQGDVPRKADGGRGGRRGGTPPRLLHRPHLAGPPPHRRPRRLVRPPGGLDPARGTGAGILGAVPVFPARPRGTPILPLRAEALQRTVWEKARGGY